MAKRKRQKAKLFCCLLLALVFAACGLGQGAKGSLESPAASHGQSAAQSGAALASQQMGEAAKPLPEKAMHFSIDDVIALFVDLEMNKDTYTSIFQNQTLAFLREMHTKYGMVTSLYCFYESYDGGFDLSLVTPKFAREFEENSAWLRVGFHARNEPARYGEKSPQEAADDQEKTIAALINICGEKSIDSVVRLHYYSANKEAVQALAKGRHGIKGLLAAGKPEDASYSLPAKEQQQLFEDDFLKTEDGVFYTPTDLWLDEIKDVEPVLASLQKEGEAKMRSGLFTVFTHEWAMHDEAILQNIQRCAQFALENGYGFYFAEDFLEEKYA